MQELEKLKQLIENSNNIVFFGGAGVSTESGVKDFRSADGIYSMKFDYPPETMLSHSFFYSHTEEFFKFYRNMMLCEGILPNNAHKALAKLEEMGKLKAVITQNIDGLHQMAGSKTVYELHGSVLRNNCDRCGKFYTVDAVKGEGVPKCACGGNIKPDVVLYEEPLKDSTVMGAVEAISKADLLIVAGTSLTVYPAAGLLRYFRGDNLVLINRDETPYDNKADLVIRKPVGQVLGSIMGL